MILVLNRKSVSNRLLMMWCGGDSDADVGTSSSVGVTPFWYFCIFGAKVKLKQVSSRLYMSNGNCCYDDKISIFICVTRTHTLTYENGDLTCYISYSLLPLPDKEEEREREEDRLKLFPTIPQIPAICVRVVHVSILGSNISNLICTEF